MLKLWISLHQYNFHKNIPGTYVWIKILKHQVYKHLVTDSKIKNGYSLLSLVFLNWLITWVFAEVYMSLSKH